MYKIALPLLLLPIAACSNDQPTAITACEMALTTVASLTPDKPSKIEELKIKDEQVHALLSSRNINDETIYEDILCLFKLDRAPTERDATYKLRAFVQKRFQDETDISLLDAVLKQQEKPTISDKLKEGGLDALVPEESGLNPA